jgi:hypothetical protein
MTAVYQEHYKRLIAAIRSHEASEMSELGKIEACFKASLDAWNKVRQEVKGIDFQTPEEEIYFFKQTKPRFTGMIEYYTQRYHALLFKPSQDPGELARFWNWEVRKIERFYLAHEGFCRYMREGRTDQDAAYFMRLNGTDLPLLSGRVHDLDPEVVSTHDHLVSMILAYELYDQYIREEMRRMGGYYFFN